MSSGRLPRNAELPRYFFQVSGVTTHFDRDGYDLPDIDAAWSLAIASTGELLRDLKGAMPDGAEIITTVSSADGREVISLVFSARREVLPDLSQQSEPTLPNLPKL